MKSLTMKGYRWRLIKIDGNMERPFDVMGCILKSVPSEKLFKKVKVGKSVLCGTIQRWVMTTPVVEILECNKEKTECKFKTKSGSTYLLKTIG